MRNFLGLVHEWCWRVGALAVFVGLPWYFGLFERDYGNKNLSDLINTLLFGSLVAYWLWATNRVVAQIRRDRKRSRDFAAAKAAGDEEEMWRLFEDKLSDR